MEQTGKYDKTGLPIKAGDILFDETHREHIFVILPHQKTNSFVVRDNYRLSDFNCNIYGEVQQYPLEDFENIDELLIVGNLSDIPTFLEDGILPEEFIVPKKITSAMGYI